MGDSGRTLEVTVTYQGGEVSETNAIYQTVWDSPNMQGSALPIATQTVSEIGGTASFSNLTASPVHVATLYDERDGWGGQSAVSAVIRRLPSTTSLRRLSEIPSRSAASA